MFSLEFVYLAVVFAIGFVLAWFVASARSRSRASQQILQLESARSSQQSLAEELKRQLDSLREESRLTNKRVEEEHSKRIAAETDLSAQRTNLEEQKRLLEGAEQKLKDAFDSLASRALESNSRQFMELAGTRFDTLREQAGGDIAGRQAAIKALVDPLSNVLKNMESKLSDLESSRQVAYGELRSRVQELTQTSKELREETGSLVSSLRQPQIKGKWGELTLRRAVELAGMSPRCDFDEQITVQTNDGRLRPDLIAHLPGGSNIVVDAKVPLHAFFSALSATNKEEYQSAMKEHAQLVRNHVSQLSSREYWKQFEPTPEFVILFVPGESFFSAALEHDHTLIEDAMEKKVVLASPTTLLALLRAVAYGWRQEEVAKNAEAIREHGKELYDRLLKFAEHFTDLGKALDRVNIVFNSAVGSYDNRLVPSARRFKSMGVSAGAEVPSIDPIEISPRPLITKPSDPDASS